MVTTRGRRASTLVEEPQLTTPRKQQSKGAWHRDEAETFTTNRALESKLRKKRPSTDNPTASPADQLPKAKRRRKETPPTSPVHKKSLRSKSPIITRKQRNQNGNTEENSSLQITQREVSTPVGSATADQDEEESSKEGILSKQPVVPASVLSRKLQPENLPVAEQLRALLQQISRVELYEANSSEVIDQIVQYWENVSSKDSETTSSTIEVSTDLQKATLPILAHVSVQILHVFASYNLKSLQQAITQPGSDGGKIFAIYQKLFRVAKSPYPSRHGFSILSELFNETLESKRSIDMTNLATFLNGCFGIDELGFYHLHEQFWNVFQQHEAIAFTDQLQLLLMLKTQACISAISNQERSKELVLRELFPEDLILQTAALRTGTANLSEEITDFESQVTVLKQVLESQVITNDEISTLRAQHPFGEFLQVLTTYISDYFETISGQLLSSIAPMCDNIHSMQFRSTEQLSTPPENDDDPEHFVDNTNSVNDSTVTTTENRGSINLVHIQPPSYLHPVPQEATLVLNQTQPMVENSHESENSPSAEDIIAQAAKAAEEALLGFSQTEVQNSSESQNHNLDKSSSLQESNQSQIIIPPQQDVKTRQQLTEPGQPYLQNHQQSQPQTQSVQYHPNIMSSMYGPPPGQTQPTAVLYERARQVANSKSSNVSRSKTASVSQRRPWTLEEEQALMDGLDQVKGPHWSQILVLYGPGGSINETLRDRTQVQLKDKARNLKLFFLKSKIEVPYYLSFVTGELKSRAPSHASTLDDTPPRPAIPSQNGQTNGNSVGSSITTASRNRIPVVTATQSMSTGMFSPILQLPQPSSTYSSPYAPIGPVLPDLLSNGDQIPSAEEDANQQDVADLATSAAAQVAAALANFNTLDLPGLDLSGSTSAEINTSENAGMEKVMSAESDSESADIVIEELTGIETEEYAKAKQYPSTMTTSPQPERIKTFDTH